MATASDDATKAATNQNGRDIFNQIQQNVNKALIARNI